MKITNIYKTTAALIFLMVAALWPAAEAWGQEYGDKYEEVKKYYATVDDGSTDKLQKVFDGDEPGSWWNAVKAGTREIIVDFNEEKELAIIKYHGGGNGQEMALRPLQVKVYFSLDGSSWDDVYNFNEIDRTVMNQILSIPVESRKKARYFKLVLVPGKKNDGSDESLALNEMWFYDSDNIEIKIKEPENYPIGTIKHKPAKWYDIRDNIGMSQAAKDMDTFDDDEKMFSPEDNPFIANYPEKEIQAAHTYIDTIYMHPGKSVTLTLPDKLNDVSVRGYQRWYSFRTDGTYRTKNTGDDEVWDLLTPKQGTSYRFTNGYVSKPIDKSDDGTYQMEFYFPTSNEFNDWFPNHGTLEGNWFVVACDVSGYNDYTAEFTNASSESDFLDKYYEPTLTHRVLYYIASVDDRDNETGTNWENGHGRLSNSDYQGGGNTEDKKYLEEYEISFPYTRMSNTQLNNQESNQPSPEQVALSKDARAYAIPKELLNGVSDTDKLTVTLIDGDGSDDEKNSGIKLIKASTYKVGGNSYRNYTNVQSLTISGENRVIQFAYPTPNSNGTQSVLNNNSTATILVTKTVNNKTYNIARYKLRFVADTRLLTQTQLSEIEDETIDDETMKYYQFRTPEYLEEHYQLLTSLNWDYDPSVAANSKGQKEYYPFPMAWDHSSYSFFDGSLRKDFVPVTKGENENEYPEWGYYAIMNDFVEDIAWGINDKASLLPNSTYHLYVDASDRPGVIANLAFKETLCRGSELFVTAWVKSAGFSIGTSDAGMLFTINGVEADGAKVPLYSHSTSQIRRTDYLSDQIPGCGSGKNEWLQVYFSFINEGDVAYESYELQVSNNSESTSGGDMYLDDVRVYLAKPTPHVSQKEYTCINERTLMNFYLDWGQLCERLGMDENSTVQGTRAIDFCFVDTVKYTNAIKEGKEPETALNLAIEHIGDGNDDPNGEGYDETIATIHFYENFNSHKEYNTQGDNLAKDNKIGDYYFFYRAGSGEDRKLSVDFYATLSPYRPYWMLIRDNTGSVSTLSDFAASINAPCGIKSDFYVEPTALIKVNGEIVKPETDFCIGQIFNFTAQVRVPTGSDDEGNNTYMLLDDVNFDWFFGTEDEFIAENSTYGNVSLNEALTQFRDIEAYRDYESMEGVSPNQETGFTQNHIDIIKHYLDMEGAAGGLHKRLVLCEPNMDISMLEGGLQLVMRPIKTQIPSSITEDQWTNVCWNYIPLVLTTNQDAPVLHAGFNSVKYPTDDFNPSLRIGLGQIQQASDEANTLIIDLRGAQLVSSGATSLGLIESRTEEENNVYQQIYLTGSTDPKCIDWLNKYPGAFSLPIGRITELFAEKYESGSDFNDHAKVYFYLTEQTLDDGTKFTFKPREGYEYTFSLHFEEHGDDVYNTCEGTFPITMKVVPEYLVWNDTQKSDDYSTIGNWNNDDNWQRVVSERIQAAEDKDSDYFTNGENENTGAFVPMLFSKVIMPRNSKVQLYAAGYGENGKWNNSVRPENIAEPTPNIQYDLMAFEHTSETADDAGVRAGDLKTERYRVSLLNQIHFEPGAEMLHAEYLLYDTAWVDYELTGGRWYTLASPLQGVVAGDFYTDSSTGKESSEYFKNIEFNTTTNDGIEDNNRFNPSVYQRAWKGNATLITTGNNSSGTSKDVAVSGNWSALYNDVTDAYTPGTGFSLKVQDLPTGSNQALFRLPKADPSYSYYSQGSIQPGGPVGITRYKPGRLRSDTLFIRNTDMTDKQEGEPIEITLSETADGNYYLVGNPFMAYLDMKEFFDGNVNLLRKYWLVTNNSQTVAVGTEEDLTMNGAGDATVAPLQSFFVQKAEGVTGEITLKFTQDMQVLGGTGDGLRSANALTITATTTDGRTSRAAVAYDMAASADYEASEDAELFLDSNLGDVPMVYTVAGTMATSINRTSELYNIPLGVYGNKQEMVTLSFGGLNQFSSATLYDAQEQTETPLREGKTVSVPAGTSGRYFLRAGTPTGNEVIARNAFLVYSVGGGKVMVTSSNTPLKDIRVYTMGGAQVRSIQASGMQQEIYLNRGIYLITVSDQDGLQETRKVLVR